MSPVIAVVRLPGGVSKAIPTFPGQRLKIVGGVGEVRHEMHMPAVLRLGPEARVELAPDWTDFLGKWLSLIGGADKVTCDLRTDGLTQTASDGAQESYADGEQDGIVFGNHAAGHGCTLCERKRAKARLAAA